MSSCHHNFGLAKPLLLFRYSVFFLYFQAQLCVYVYYRFNIFLETSTCKYVNYNLVLLHIIKWLHWKFSHGIFGDLLPVLGDWLGAKALNG